MRQTIIGIVLLGVVFGASLAFSQKGGERRGGEGVLSVLSKGQAVSVKEVSGRYEIGVMPNAEMLGYKVVVVGSDYLVVQDIAGATELRIPIYSIKAVSILKAGQ
jgi:hypothetical protein